jgi:hypothetical protein
MRDKEKILQSVFIKAIGKIGITNFCFLMAFNYKLSAYNIIGRKNGKHRSATILSYLKPLKNMDEQQNVHWQ